MNKISDVQPYLRIVIIFQKGSKEEAGSQHINQIIEALDRLNIDAILDDRTGLTIGNRFMHARVTGFPYVIILGKGVMKSPPLVEVHNINNSTNSEIPLDNVDSYFNNENIKT